MQAETPADIRRTPELRAEVIDVTRKRLEAIGRVKDDIAFCQAVRENKDKIPVVSLVELMRERMETSEKQATSD